MTLHWVGLTILGRPRSQAGMLGPTMIHVHFLVHRASEPPGLSLVPLPPCPLVPYSSWLRHDEIQTRHPGPLHG